MNKHFLKLLDFTPAEIQQFLDTAPGGTPQFRIPNS